MTTEPLLRDIFWGWLFRVVAVVRFVLRPIRWAWRKSRAVTVVFLLSLTPTWPGEAIRFVTYEPLMDGFLMALTYRTEVYYLNSTEELDPANNVHSVRGCHYAGECAEHDAVYFRVRPRLSHDIWKLILYGNPIYVPDHIIAPIAPGVNECHVTYYGYRLTASYIARLVRSMQIYPTMLEASCHYLGGRNVAY
jgi:hypothetical protein